MAKKKSDCCDTTHPDHTSELGRLNRISGQIEGVKKMITEKRYCPEIIAQLRAIRSAAHSIEANILEAHLDSCVKTALGRGGTREKEEKIAELKELYRRFNG